MQKLYQVVIHNTDSLESQSLGYMDKSVAERLVDDLRRVINPGHTIELIVTDDDCLEE